MLKSKPHHKKASINDLKTLDTSSTIKRRILTPGNRKDRSEIPASQFFQTLVLQIDDWQFTIHKFLLGLAYNGSIHMMPTKNTDENDALYEHFFLKYPKEAYDLSREIAQALLDVFNELYSYLNGKKDGFSPNNNFQPMIVSGGKLLDGGWYKRAFMQFPVQAKKGHGIRLMCDLKLHETSENKPILNYGHREKAKLKVSVWQSGAFINSGVSLGGNRPVIGRINIGMHLNRYFDYEIAVYPSGMVSIGINGILKCSLSLKSNVNMSEGKVILGSNLDGKSFGDFFNNELIIQSIDKNDRTKNLGVFGNKILSIRPQKIPYNLIKRNK